jgi:hypothetical protein
MYEDLLTIVPQASFARQLPDLAVSHDWLVAGCREAGLAIPKLEEKGSKIELVVPITDDSGITTEQHVGIGAEEWLAAVWAQSTAGRAWWNLLVVNTV